MTGTSTVALAALFWAMLVIGAALASVGLWRSALRYRAWRQIGAEEEAGEIVLGDSALREGQTACIAPGERVLPTDPSGVVTARIVRLSKKHCVLALDTDPGSEGPAIMPRAGWPSPGGMVTVSVTGATALFRFTARVRDISPGRDRGSVQIILPRPFWLTRLQRRQHTRIDLQMPTTLERAEGRSRWSAPLHGTVLNLSAGGLRVRVGGVSNLRELDSLTRVFAPETTIRVRLPLPALPGSAVLGRVLTCERAVVRGGLTLQLTCEFLPMPDWEQEIVIHHVFQLQRATLSKKLQ